MLSDLEITKACADAMGYRVLGVGEHWGGVLVKFDNDTADNYDPLTNDAQAMALVKKFKLHTRWWDKHIWLAQSESSGAYRYDLNRAICECVAKMQAK